MSGDVSGVIGNHLSRFDTGALNQPDMPSFGELALQAAAGELDLSFQGLLELGGKALFAVIH